MTLGSLITSCGLRTGFNDPAYRPQWREFLNESIREFARQQPWPGLENFVDLKTDGTKFLILPSHVDTVVSLFNVTNVHRIDRAGDWDRNAPVIEAKGTGGDVIEYTRAGNVAATRDPTGYVWFRSSHASDTQTVSITGLVANSGASGALEQTVSTITATAVGVSPVTFSALFTKLLSVARSTEASGDFFFFDAADDHYLSFIPKDETDASFLRLQLLYVPTTQQTLRLRYRLKPPKLVADSSAPHPSVKTDFIIQHALSIHWAEQEQLSKAQAQEAKAARVLGGEANKDENFNEPHTRMSPLIDVDPDDWTR